MAKSSFLQSKKRKEAIASALCFLAVLLLAAFAMLPLYWIIRSSLMTNAELYHYPPAFLPSRWLWSNYAETMESFPFWHYLGNTAKIIIPSVTFGTVTAVLSGYAFARLRFPGKKLTFMLCVGSMLLPNMVTLIPLYLFWTRICGFHDSFMPLILPYLCGGGAFQIFLIRQFISSIPKELDQAAEIDGAGKIRILVSILLPAIKAAIIVVAMFLFIQIWNDLLTQTIYLDDPDMYTLSIGLSMFKGGLKADWSKIMCSAVLSFIPGFIIFLIGQRYFVEGIVMTGMKN